VRLKQAELFSVIGIAVPWVLIALVSEQSIAQVFVAASILALIAISLSLVAAKAMLSGIHKEKQ
jgi:hypothetical protein